MVCKQEAVVAAVTHLDPMACASCPRPVSTKKTTILEKANSNRRKLSTNLLAIFAPTVARQVTGKRGCLKKKLDQQI